MIGRPAPNGTLGVGVADPVPAHGLVEGALEAGRVDARRDLGGGRGQRPLGQRDRRAHALDLGRELHGPHRAHEGLAVDQLRLGGEVAQQRRQAAGHAVAGQAAGVAEPGEGGDVAHDHPRVPRQAAEVLVGDLLGHAVVPRRVQEVDPAVGPQRAERRPRRDHRPPDRPVAGDVAGVALAPEQQQVDAGIVHGRQDAIAPVGPEAGEVDPGAVLQRHRPAAHGPAHATGSSGYAPIRS